VSGWAEDVLSFWFNLDEQQWWDRGSELDRSIRRDFRELWEQKRVLTPSAFLEDARTSLAAAILFDQFPRNMFRDAAEQFATDSLALAIADDAIHGGLDQQLEPPRERQFLYMPFMHSEDRENQLRSLQLFTALGQEEQLHFAKLHQDIIERFGRFPHRNAILGRTPRPEEIAAGPVVPW
jgi:uncharacterized protein (DUF924 family)